MDFGLPYDDLEMIEDFNKYKAIRNAVYTTLEGYVGEGMDARIISVALNEILNDLCQAQPDNFNNKVQFILKTINESHEQHPSNLEGFKSLMEDSEYMES